MEQPNYIYFRHTWLMYHADADAVDATCITWSNGGGGDDDDDDRNKYSLFG